MITFSHENIKWMKDERELPACFYKIKIPSVTTIISSEIPDPEWDEFIAKVGKERADEILMLAGQRGTSMHIFLENFLSSYTKDKDISKALKYTQEESPKKLLLENIPENKISEGRDYFYKFYYSDYVQQYSDIISLEMGIYSPSLFYRGKLDVLYKNRIFGLALTDFKSSNGKIKKGSVKELKYKYQLGGYALALDHMYAEKNLILNKASILCVDKQTDILQEVECSGKELQEFKQKFKEITISYHEKNNTAFLLNKT